VIVEHPYAFRTLTPSLSRVSDAQAAISVNGSLRNLPDDCATVADLVRDMKLEGKRIAVEKNGAIVPRTRYAETPLAAGDRVEIVGAVGGG
jgi:sulfur carrier protein